MRISNIKLLKFRRFASLEIRNVHPNAKLVVLAGQNGSGKSSIFDALLTRYRVEADYGWSNDLSYYNRAQDQDPNYVNRIEVQFHDAFRFVRGGLYIRTAHRHEASFTVNQIRRTGNILDSMHLNKSIDLSVAVSANYTQLASQAMEEIFISEPASTTIGEYREKIIGEIRAPLERLFPDLIFKGVGNPLDSGTFKFQKGAIEDFDYKNLSGGEKAAFDLILDFVLKKNAYEDAIYCIDEPEVHLNTKIQGALLNELVDLLPDKSQLWIASHSIGMMRKAREIYDKNHESVAFFDFSSHDFDQTIVMEPKIPTRAFWEGMMKVALDDLSNLVAPSKVVICEGAPLGANGNSNASFDAACYNQIFEREYPDVKFISAGSSNQVEADRMALMAAMRALVSGTEVIRLIDRDDHSIDDIHDRERQGIRVLSRRNIESYLFDDEVLAKFCKNLNKEEFTNAVIESKMKAIEEICLQGKSSEDIKSASGLSYNAMKRILKVSFVGNNAKSFMRSSLAPIITVDMNIYKQLRADIFKE